VAVFVDTGAFYALADRNDPGHQAALDQVGRVAPRGLVTTDYVFVEASSLIESRLGPDAARRYWAGMRGGAAALLGVLGVDLARAWAIVHAWPSESFGLVDATSFAAMERLGLRDVLSFDRHFRIYRYGPGRRRAFRPLLR
jgi:uncharacterized protein